MSGLVVWSVFTPRLVPLYIILVTDETVLFVASVS